MSDRKKGVIRVTGLAAFSFGIITALLVGAYITFQEKEKLESAPMAVPLEGSCDDALRALALERSGVEHAGDLNDLVAEIQGARQDCRQNWGPFVIDALGENLCGEMLLAEPGRIDGKAPPEPLRATRSVTVMMPMMVSTGKTTITSMMPVENQVPTDQVGTRSMRDPQGNLLVHFDRMRQPRDGSNC